MFALGLLQGDVAVSDGTTVAIIVVVVALVGIVLYVLGPGGKEEPAEEGLPGPEGVGARAALEEKPSEEPAEAAEEPAEPAAGEDKAAEPAEPVEKPRTLREGLGRTRKEGFIAKLGSLFKSKELEEDLADRIEEVLFTADIGVKTADRLLDKVRSSRDSTAAGDVWALLKEEATSILEAAGANDTRGTPKEGEPFVTMVLGVNGTGKTTSIGKLAHQLIGQGKKVSLIAGDTFRAAAAEQLEVWGRRVDAPVYRGKEGADPASVVYDGVRSALEDQVEFVLVDTAGRLHTQVNLMEELRKVRRVMGEAIEGAPHEVLMVLDATTGQNAVQQAKMFKDATDVTGIILTKLDGTAKGGIVIGVCDEMAIPIRYIGIGERVDDLRAFDPDEFVSALFGQDTT